VLRLDTFAERRFQAGLTGERRGKSALDQRALADACRAQARNAAPVQPDGFPLQVGRQAEAPAGGDRRHRSPGEPAPGAPRREAQWRDQREGALTGLAQPQQDRVGRRRLGGGKRAGQRAAFRDAHPARRLRHP